MHLKKLILAAGLAAAVRAQAAVQVEVEVRTLGGEWKTFSSAGVVLAGTPGSRAVLDGLSVRIPGVKVEIIPCVEGKAVSKTWTTAGQPAGSQGKRLEGFSLRVDKGWIRYRASFAGVGIADWVQGGEPIGQPGSSLFLESLEVEYREISPEDGKVEFRAAFRGAGFTPWLPAGSVAEGRGDRPALVALEVRSGYDVRYEVFARGTGWTTPTAVEGRAAGDPAGQNAAKGVRVFPGKTRLAVRVKQGAKGWSNWCYAGEACGDLDAVADIAAVQIAREAKP